MNLIEQLGGYENLKLALAELRGKKKDLIQCGSVFLVENEVLELLLEYRRQHNIFEVGDKVVYLYPSIRNGIYEFLDKVGDDSIWIKTPLNSLLRERISYIRHATDEEIAAGRRL